MTETAHTPPYTLGPDEKAAQVMIYTNNSLYWGDVVVKQMIRVSTWLRTNAAPDRVTLYNAKVMNVLASTPSRPAQFRELYVATNQILAFHLVPPAKDPPDFDASEPNRRMQPVSLLLSTFRVDGHLRLAAQTAVSKFLETTRETFTSVYDAQISNPNMSGLGVISVPYLIIRQETTVFAMV